MSTAIFNQIRKFKNCLNLYHINIKFTSEIEINNSLSLLDINYQRKQQVTISVYFKSAHSLVFLLTLRVLRSIFSYQCYYTGEHISATYIFPCIMTMISNFMIFFIFQMFIFKSFFTNITDFCIFI